MITKYLSFLGALVLTMALYSCDKPEKLLIVGDKDSSFLGICDATAISYTLYPNVADAVDAAGHGQGIMLLSAETPSTEQISIYDSTIKEKGLKVFVEFNRSIPGLEFTDSILEINKERAVVYTDSIDGLDSLDVLSINNKEMLLLKDPSLAMQNSILLLGKVAGYDNAEYGLEGATMYPLLFTHQKNYMVSTMGISNVIQGRFGPSAQWEDLYTYVLSWLTGQEIDLEHWESSVHPTYKKDDTLDVSALKLAVKSGVDWYYNAKLLVDQSWVDLYEKNASKNGRDVVYPGPAEDMPLGNGLHGILEGHASRINPDGSQPYRWWIRGDCQAETAFAMSSAALYLGDQTYKETAKNLLQYLFKESNLRQGERNDPDSPSFGLIGWATTDNDAYYGDDNARALLGAIGASSNLDIDLWDAQIIEGVLGNFRTAGTNGFRGPWFRDAAMQETTWQALGQREIVNIHPHYESWLWSLYIWLYDKTGYEPLLDKAKSAISITMEAFPNWKWTNGVQQEYARMILPLSWLVQIEDTKQHRDWLKTVAQTLLEAMDESGAIPERLGKEGFGRYEKIASNAEYGTKEAPLISSTANEVSDLLYTMNFAFFALNEASHATGEQFYADAVDKIADFMIRIQVDSKMHKDLDGAWFRAFDFEKWEYWASNADSDWGPWGTLTGWTQSWIINGLIYKQTNKSLWDSSKEQYNTEAFKALAWQKINSMLKQ